MAYTVMAYIVMAYIFVGIDSVSNRDVRSNREHIVALGTLHGRIHRLCIHMCIGLYTEICVDMRIGICTDMHMTCASSCVSTCVPI